jgi:preprotein translocase subunit SecA
MTATLRRFLQQFSLPSRLSSDAARIRKIRAATAKFITIESDRQLGEIATAHAQDVNTVFAVTTVFASRKLGQDMFDVQLRGALALARGSIAEMQTGEGKTLTAVPAAAWYARAAGGVHVMTVNDYLARRDATWMSPIYTALGLSVGYLQQGMSPADRRSAYACDVLYATANEIGFDFLRDRLALHPEDQVQQAKAFRAVVVDEADSILIDEARIPLVIAGGDSGSNTMAVAADQVVRGFRTYIHYTVDPGAHNVALTDLGVARVESAFACGNLYDEPNLTLLTAIQDALHAHALLKRDTDYIVRDGMIEMVDEFKGRVALNRRWPAGLHSAVEIKEGVNPKRQGLILGSITLQHLIGLYPHVCGMTGTASTQSQEFDRVYGLAVEVIPTNRPVIRRDEPDRVFRTKFEKQVAVLDEIRRVHSTGRPVLVGSSSVEESECLSRLLGDIPNHRVLNARQDEQEAAIIARAGERGAVTISTNMAGRGTDIQLGPDVAALGGLHVIGMQRHESRRIDNQLRGRAGRQGDPGSSRFFVSMEDDLLVKYGDLKPHLGRHPETVQRLVEGHHLDARIFLQRYETAIEGQRHRIHTLRQDILEGKVLEYPAGSMEQQTALWTIDDVWSDYLAQVAEFRAGLPWLDWGLAGLPGVTLDRRDAYYEYAQQIHKWFSDLEAGLSDEIALKIEEASASPALQPRERGAVWTYLTTDQPFGSFTERMIRGLRRKFGAAH